MKTHDIDEMLHQMEENAEDELSFLLSTGAAYFSTSQLLRLRGQWESKNYLFHKLFKIWIRVGATAPIWFGIWLICHLIGLKMLGLFFLLLCPFSLLFFFGGMLIMRHLFQGKGHLDMIGEIINQELKHRKQL